VTRFWPTALSGTAATLLGIGLARFAFVPLFPAMVTAGWVEGEGAAILGAVALATYLAGALSGQALARRIGVPRALDAGAWLVVLSFAACAWNGGFWWLACWRGVAGIAGGWLMTLAGPAVQAAVEPARRGLASGLVVAGVASGITIGALAMPVLLLAGPETAWAMLALGAAAAWLWATRNWPRVPAPVAGMAGGWSPLLSAYALSAVGMVVPMIYLSDLAVRAHGYSLASGALAWACFGAGALCGTLAGGRVVDRIGGLRAARLWLWVQVVGMVLLLPPVPVLVWPGAFACGFAGVGVTAVMLALVREAYGARAPAVWVRSTVGYAAAQAVTAFAAAALFAATNENHTAVFGMALLASLGAVAIRLRA
jgi:predicted MFS family arabinose efflux permease